MVHSSAAPNRPSLTSNRPAVHTHFRRDSWTGNGLNGALHDLPAKTLGRYTFDRSEVTRADPDAGVRSPSLRRRASRTSDLNPVRITNGACDMANRTGLATSSTTSRPTAFYWQHLGFSEVMHRGCSPMLSRADLRLVLSRSGGQNVGGGTRAAARCSRMVAHSNRAAGTTSPSKWMISVRQSSGAGHELVWILGSAAAPSALAHESESTAARDADAETRDRDQHLAGTCGIKHRPSRV